MRCVVCNTELRRHELPQPMRFQGEAHRVPALCDGCCRANLGRGGSAASLQRLVDGKLDEAEVRRLAETL